MALKEGLEVILGQSFLDGLLGLPLVHGWLGVFPGLRSSLVVVLLLVMSTGVYDDASRLVFFRLTSCVFNRSLAPLEDRYLLRLWD